MVRSSLLPLCRSHLILPFCEPDQSDPRSFRKALLLWNHDRSVVSVWLGGLRSARPGLRDPIAGCDGFEVASDGHMADRAEHRLHPHRHVLRVPLSKDVRHRSRPAHELCLPLPLVFPSIPVVLWEASIWLLCCVVLCWSIRSRCGTTLEWRRF